MKTNRAMKLKLLFSLVFLIICVPIYADGFQIKRVAILDIVDDEKIFSDGFKLLIRSRLSSAIANSSGYESYDRVDLASIIDEHEFQRTGLVNDIQIKQLGKMVGADYILMTEVARLDDSNIIIIAKILNVETAEVERISDITTTVDVITLQDNCQKLIEKLLAINFDTRANRGKLKLSDNIYIGESKDGKPNGKGVMRFCKKDKLNRKSYDGEWKNGLCNGIGVMIYENSVYKGEFKNGMRDGYGDYSFKGYRYNGNWKNDKRNGYGTLTYPLSCQEIMRFEGYWDNGMKIGMGTIIYRNGDKEFANYKNDKREGTAKYCTANGYETGLYVNDKRDGKWTCFDSKNLRIAIKTYKNGKLLRTKKVSKR